MKQLTVNIPDNFISSFMEYFNQIPNAYIVKETDFLITPEMLEILDESHNTPNELYITKDESNRLIKEKYGL